MKLPLLPVLAALGLLFGGLAAPASTPPTLPTLSSVQTIYAGSFQNNRQYWGWAQAEAPCPAPALSASSLRVQEGAWQAVYLHHAPLTTTAGQTLSFWINGGPTGGQQLSVAALRSNVTQTVVALTPLKANTWQQAPFFVDKITLSQGPGSVPPAPAPPAPAPPAVPGGLSATPVSAKSCPVSGGMAMAHIVTGWNAVSGASS